jgi:DNA-binding CsgD family transcriptional regulator
LNQRFLATEYQIPPENSCESKPALQAFLVGNAIQDSYCCYVKISFNLNIWYNNIINKKRIIMDKSNKYTILLFTIIFGWILSMPYEGPILYSILEDKNIGNIIISLNILAHALGLVTAGLFVKEVKRAKKIIIAFSSISFILTMPILFIDTKLIEVLLPISSYLTGVCIASIGSFLKNSIPKSERTNAVAFILIFGNVLLILVDILTTISPLTVGFLFNQICLLVAIVFSFKIDIKSTKQKKTKDKVENNKKYWMFYLFIFIITLNSGIMFRIIYPYFGELSLLKSIFTNIPYIIAIYLLCKIKKNKFYFLFVGLALWFMVFVLFIFAKPSPVYFIVIFSLMMFACGIYDLFWWTIMANNVDNTKKPVMLFGLGLFANVFGVLVGEIIGGFIIKVSNSNLIISIFGICITVVSMLGIIPLNFNLIKKTNFLDFLLMTKDAEKETKIIPEKVLTAREYDIFLLLMENKTNQYISDEKHITLSTVKFHNRSIYKKLNVHIKKELIDTYKDLSN